MKLVIIKGKTLHLTGLYAHPALEGRNQRLIPCSGNIPLKWVRMTHFGLNSPI
jgi:hypothetical protein